MDLGAIVGTLTRGLPQAVVSGLVYGSIYALIAQGYFVTFSTPGTDTHIRHSRAIECKGLGMYYGFLANLECMQFKGAICS